MSATAYDPAQHIPPPVELVLTLRYDPARGRVYLSQALVAYLGLRASQPINLLPPAAGKHWYLDLRPTATRKICWYDDTRPRIEGVRLGPEGAPTGPVVLRLKPGPPPHPDYYPLEVYAQSAA